ncbi:MAG TPA: ribonuclease H-like domain-containing protein [Chitinophaga sp.]|uniref:ribonuclease H-like domain-containing protein n=1 Tax=Chitinophaga sp. TaxID=1869181 RepID=UPI002BB8EE72|nr:ribonuclease H-like domain-containing protein [Chitinophaga sp.]HVI44893.1 ribonuclease H-like domain-containing protein [Chitinophaga sp.]
MLPNIALDQLLVLDIETTPGAPALEHLSMDMQQLWQEKMAKIAPESENPAEGYADRAGIYAEFGRIVCISVGFFHLEHNHYSLRLKSFYNDDESVVLNGFLELVNKFYAKYPRFQFAGHNIREFDIPFICRRSVIHHLSLPQPLQLHGFKPWEVPMLDTLHLWRFGDFKHYTSLKLLTAILGVETPKDDIDGSMVGRVYWQDKDLPRIAAYCQKDVVAVAQLLLRFKRLPLLNPADIIIVG